MVDKPRVEIACRGEDAIFWLQAYINGTECRPVVHVESIHAGSQLEPELRRLVENSYGRGYSIGYADALKNARESLGIKDSN